MPADVMKRLHTMLGRFARDGRLLEVGPHWPLRPDLQTLADMVESDHSAAVRDALGCCRDGEVHEFSAPFRDSAVHYHWLLWPVDAESFHVFVLPMEPGPTIAHAIANGVDAGVSLTDSAGRIQHVNAAYGGIYGFEPRELIGCRFTDLLEPADRASALDRHYQLIRGECSATRQEFQVRTHVDEQEGEWRFVRASSARLQLPQGVFRLATVVDVTELRQSEYNLAESEARYQHIFDNTSEGIFLSSHDGRLLEVNWPLVRIQECQSKQELLDAVQDLRFDWYVHPEDRERMLALIERDGAVEEFEAEVHRIGTGERFWTSESVSAIRDADGRFVYFQGTVRDITEQRRQQDLAARRAEVLEMIARDVDLTEILYELVGAIEQNHTRLTAAIFRLNDGLLETCAAPALDQGCIRAVNGCPPSKVGGPVAAAMRYDRPVFDVELPAGDRNQGTLARALDRAGYGNAMAVPVRDQSGAVLGVLTVFAASAGDTPPALAATLREMAQIVSLAFEQQRLADRLQHQAYYDDLTGLPNRMLFSDRLGQLMREAERNQDSVAVMMLDLDEFKLINDTLGHKVGDLLLEQVARRLETCLRAGDTVARFGGDEFVVLVLLDRSERASDVATRILDALHPAIVIADRELQARPSIGISLFPDDGNTAENLVQAADTAMYAAKRAGKNRFRYFAESMNEEIAHQLRTTTDLRKALETEGLVLHYQPIIDCVTEGVVGAEALLRWHHPQRGLLLPGQFLPVAEQSELIHDIDRFVMAAAVRQAAAWQGSEMAGSVAINLSTRSLDDPSFAVEFAAMLGAAGLPPACVELEITESMVMRDFARAVAHLRDLRERLPGMRIAVDDFGTGHASLEYVRQLPIDVLKVDRTFVADLDREDDPRGRETAGAIVRTIVELARNLGLETVAEGVETEAQACHLRQLGCQRAQGFLFGHPVDAEAFMARFIRCADNGGVGNVPGE